MVKCTSTCIFVLVFSFLFCLLQQIGICRMTSMKLRHCRSVWGSLLNTYPQSFVVHYHEAIGGTVHVLMLERVELIDGDIHQECSLRYARNSKIRKLASAYFCLKRKTRFVRNINIMSTHLKHVEILKI